MSKPKEAKERRKLLGGAVCGFVSAQTTDEACFEVFAGIQNISESRFGSSFIEKVKEVFPTSGDITPPPKNLHEEWNEIFSLEDKVLSALRKKLGPDFEGVRCNRDDYSFELITNESNELSSLRDSFLEFMRYSESSVFFQPGSPIHPREVAQMFTQSNHMTKIPASDPDFLQIVEDISVVDDIFNLEKSWIRFNTILLHKDIQVQQRSVIAILDCLVQGKLFHEEGFVEDGPLWGGRIRNPADPSPTVDLVHYLDIYNAMPRTIIEIDQQDGLKELYKIREEDYLSINLPLKWLDRIKGDLAYCLIEFLMPERNRKYMGKCPCCNHFFIKEQTNRVKCYSNDCERTYQARKKKKQRDKDPVKYL